jgi:Domain of unknown function (DUF4331)
MNAASRVAAWLVLAAALGAAQPTAAADHADAPASTLDPSADLTDVFVFRKQAGKLVGVIAFGGAPAPRPRVDGPTGRFDPDVIFTYWIDTDRDSRPDLQVHFRFGTNSLGQSGVEIENLPGAGYRYVFGPVETVNTTPNGLRFYAGLRDDPFFFDSQGFRATLDSFGDASAPDGTLMFDNTRDSFAARNVTVLVFEMDEAAATRGSDQIYVWATSGRLP